MFVRCRGGSAGTGGSRAADDGARRRPTTNSASSVPFPRSAMAQAEVAEVAALVRAALQHQPFAKWFSRPVTELWPEAAAVYAAEVARTMDLGTLAAAVVSGQYADGAAARADLRRVWRNCYQFNGRACATSRVAEALERFCEGHLAVAAARGRRGLPRPERWELENLTASLGRLARRERRVFDEAWGLLAQSAAGAAVARRLSSDSEAERTLDLEQVETAVLLRVQRVVAVAEAQGRARAAARSSRRGTSPRGQSESDTESESESESASESW